MTDKEKAIIMAHTGICMLTGDKFQIFHKYVEDVMGRPIMTHEIGLLADTIKEKTKADFIALCEDESSSENPNKWIPVSERLPEKYDEYIVAWMSDQFINNGVCRIGICEYEPSNEYDFIAERFKGEWLTVGIDPTYQFGDIEVYAWMELPEKYVMRKEQE